jgi:serine/threonine-protein phosphatase 2B catalytic subunit
MVESGKSSSKHASSFKAETLKDLVDPQDRLPDSCDDRKVKEVRAPPNRPLSLDRVFPYADFRSRKQEPDLELLKAYLVEQGSLSKDLMHYLVAQNNTIMRKEPNLHRIDGSVIIIGDIHG